MNLGFDEVTAAIAMQEIRMQTGRVPQGGLAHSGVVTVGGMAEH